MSVHSVNVFQCFTHEQVKEINKKIRINLGKKQHSEDAAQNVNKIGEFSYVSCLPLMEMLHPWLYQCQKINREVFGYDIYWNFHLDTLSYNVYGTNGEYNWHIDGNKTNAPADIKLTCLLNLSEETYEGGDFHLTVLDEKRNFVSGEGIIFTSPIAHKVTPVTKGERITLTYWAYGPSWR